nr:ATP synthase F0 subunit 8 [Aphrodes bicincta]WRK21222.1 ATP synthase F0 subunit 8 [Aphrodes bicincta]
MPQMAPMWWLTLMMMVLFTIISMNSLLYFNFKSLNTAQLVMAKKMKIKW